MINIEILELSNGKKPFDIWLYKIKDKNIKDIIYARLDRVENGNFGDFKYLGDEIYELKFAIGIRIYFAKIKNSLVILLCVGDKSSQKRDIEKAKKYWQENKEMYEKTH